MYLNKTGTGNFFKKGEIVLQVGLAFSSGVK
jgi:hypothetical protein